MKVREKMEIVILSKAQFANLLLCLSVVTQIATGHIIRVSEPFPGSRNERWMFEQGGMLELARSCQEKGLADAGYNNDDWKDVLTFMEKPGVRRRKLTSLENLMNRCICACRQLTERANGLLKNWGILSRPFRGNIDHHERIFKIACRLTNMRIDMSPLVSKPHPVLLNQKVTFIEKKSSQDK